MSLVRLADLGTNCPPPPLCFTTISATESDGNILPGTSTPYLQVHAIWCDQEAQQSDEFAAAITRGWAQFIPYGALALLLHTAPHFGSFVLPTILPTVRSAEYWIRFRHTEYLAVYIHQHARCMHSRGTPHVAYPTRFRVWHPLTPLVGFFTFPRPCDFRYRAMNSTSK